MIAGRRLSWRLLHFDSSVGPAQTRLSRRASGGLLYDGCGGVLVFNKSRGWCWWMTREVGIMMHCVGLYLLW